MVNSTISRGQGLYNTAASTSLIELGIFQQALREAIAVQNDPVQKDEWTAFLNLSVSSAIQPLSNATRDAELPLDRLSIGSAMTYQQEANHDGGLLGAIEALRQSVLLQPRNADGSLWYFANPANLSYYSNLSYLDGMYSYAPFAVLYDAVFQGQNENAHLDALFGPAAALEQLQILYDVCKQPSGLLVHGFDASKAHSCTFNNLYNDIASAQIEASDRSLRETGKYGVWQVVDQPGNRRNFVEASASCMTVYSLLRGVRLGFIEDDSLRKRAVEAAQGIYQGVVESFVSESSNGTLSLNGTSSVASLSGESVDYEYYVSRPTVLNSLIGTSAFILASLEIERSS
ncbi:hypothetical protein B0A55_02475 [Friedmanniomyces simplex]|uniref:Uncharacterized protein n=1 Tax=Friedmanniomyces simplex TaxID=329884 RepID=A0A4U0XWU4_9PEZI|nr:hypothetical protein B0A55_02475 [Friedmanniomyces simplex]